MGINFGRPNGTGMGIKSEASQKFGIGNGNELMGMGGNGNVANHSRTSLLRTLWEEYLLRRPHIQHELK